MQSAKIFQKVVTPPKTKRLSLRQDQLVHEMSGQLRLLGVARRGRDLGLMVYIKIQGFVLEKSMASLVGTNVDPAVAAQEAPH